MQKTKRSLLLSLSCLSLGLFQAGAALAGDDAKAANKAAASTTGGAADPASEIAILKQEEQQLRRMSESIKRSIRAALDLITECTQPVQMAGEIDIIGQDVIPITPMTAEGFGNNYNPPRPQYINLHMAQLAALMPILQDEVSSLVVPPSEKNYVDPIMDDIKGNMGDLTMHFQKLQELTKTDEYERLGIISESRGVISSCKALDSARKKMLHEDAKVEKADEKLERAESGSNKSK